MPQLFDLTGKRIGALTVISRIEESPTDSIRWNCKCDCGKACTPLGVNLRNGRATTCGCKITSRRTFDTTKICARCRVEKTHSFFTRVSDKKFAPYCDECHLIRQAERYAANSDLHCGRVRKNNKKIRDETVAAYGGKCVCCGESDKIFLAVDHLHGGGGQHRREIGRSGTRFYIWLRDQGYPADYQLLCHNCNWAKFRTGDCCPHKQPSWMPPQIGGGPFLCIGG